MPILCGGETYDRVYSDICFKYSPLTDSWLEYGTMPYARGYSASAYLKDFGLVMAGGYDGSGLESGVLDSVIVTKDGYTFDELESLPVPSYYGCLAVADEQTLLLTGGFTEEMPNGETWVLSYDIPTDTWTRCSAEKSWLYQNMSL